MLSPLSTIFLFVYALCISLGGDIAIIDYALKMGVENDKKDFDLAYVTLHITLWFSLKHGYSMSWYFDAFLHVGYM